MRHLTATLIASLVVALCAGCTQGPKKIRLRYKFQPGLALTYEQVSKQTSRVLYPDSSAREKSMTFNVKVDQWVKRVLPDGGAEIVELDTWSWDRPSKEDTTVMEKVEETRHLELEVQPDGKVTTVRFVDCDDYTKIQYLKNYYEQGMPVFPSNELTPGDSWTQTTKVVLPNESMEASTTYRMVSLVREAGYDCAVIECDGSMILPIEPDPADSMKRSGLDRIESTGRLYFAYKEGMVVLQRERWAIDRDRVKTAKDKTERYKEAIELDIEFVLKQRSLVDSLSI